MRKGSALVELIITVAIILLLVSIAIPACSRVTCSAERAAEKKLSKNCKTMLYPLKDVVRVEESTPVCPACVCECRGY